VAQQKSVLHYWSKHHGVFGRIGIGSIILFHHLLRYCLAVVSSFANSRRREIDNVRKQVSAACLRAMFSATGLRKA
jgi:hypothetical protein